MASPMPAATAAAAVFITIKGIRFSLEVPECRLMKNISLNS